MSYVNEAMWDRGIRILLAAVLLYLGWSGVVAGSWGNFLKYFGLVPLLTGLVGWCPIYYLFGIRTNKQPAPQN